MSELFDTEIQLPSNVESFDEFGLTNSINKSLKKMKLTKPTSIQSKTIPVALMSKDICASSVTGSGKTLSFLIPTVERILRHYNHEKYTKCVILSPTRELAFQTYKVFRNLTEFTTLTSYFIAGGSHSSAKEEKSLLELPDFIIGTPGRLVDHLKNTKDFNLNTVEVFILDEADKLLKEGFQTQIEEIIKSLPDSRQNILVTATFNTSVNRLVELALKDPVRIELDSLYDVSDTLKQEFVKAEKEDRMACLIALCSRVSTEKTIIFTKQKKDVHKIYIVLTVLGFSCAEYHGDMSQNRRYDSVVKFESGKVDYLISTDIASRGIDIKGVKHVINYHMPGNVTDYVHRVGRTARIGKEGMAISICCDDEKERNLLRMIVSKSKHNFYKREIPKEIIQKTKDRLEELKEAIEQRTNDDKYIAELEKAERELQKTKELLKSPDESLRTHLFVSNKKRTAKDATRVAAKIKRQNLKFKKKSKLMNKEKPNHGKETTKM